MKIIILAAGKGERLMPLTRNTPKPLLDLGNGNTLLEEQITSIQRSEVIDEIVLVVGYLADHIDAKIRYYQTGGTHIRTIFNPFYGMSNNLISLWLAQHEMNTDFMITNGDNLFTPDVFADLVASNGDGITLSVSKKDDYDYDDMRVTLSDGTVAHVSKQIEKELTHAESPGLALVRGERAVNLYRTHLNSLVRNEAYLNKFWLETFNNLYSKGVHVRPWFFDASTRWQEIDFHVDASKLRDRMAITLQDKVASHA